MLKQHRTDWCGLRPEGVIKAETGPRGAAPVHRPASKAGGGPGNGASCAGPCPGRACRSLYLTCVSVGMS
ncbi:unnamed protein product [Lota lota]